MTVLHHVATRAKALVALTAALGTVITPLLASGRVTSHDWITAVYATIGAFGVYHASNASNGVLRYAKGLMHGATTFVVFIGAFAQSVASGITYATVMWWQVLVMIIGTIAVIYVRNKTHAEVSR